MARSVVLTAALLCATASAQLTGIFSGFNDHPAIDYPNRPLSDRVSELNRKLHDGRVQLHFDGPSGYLRSVLDALAIPVESQIAVFSKTSLQAQIISPRNPRTIFFNDSVAAAWVRGEPFVEVAAHDPEQGVVFFVLPQQPSARPQFLREDGPCLRCHDNYSTLGVPGTLLRSVYPAITGLPYRTLGDRAADDRTPFADRWGGWYVTGKLEAGEHLGNTVYFDPENPAAHRRINVKIDPPYLTPYSDVAALMVFEHQMHVINLLTRFNWELRYADYEKKPFDVAAAAKRLASYLLFVDEAPLPGKIAGTSGFAEKFAAAGPRDRQGRSLRQLDLEKRLLRYRCSYMIYSAAFNALPGEARSAIYQSMWQILATFSSSDRQPIVEILRDTKSDLPAYFHE